MQQPVSLIARAIAASLLLSASAGAFAAEDNALSDRAAKGVITEQGGARRLSGDQTAALKASLSDKTVKNVILLIGDGILHIIDFKYGQGVPVSPERNPQLMYYALGAYALFEGIEEVSTVRLSIVQPRMQEEPQTWVVSLADLLTWAREVLQPAAEMAWKGKGEFCTGPHCHAASLAGAELHHPQPVAQPAGDLLGGGPENAAQGRGGPGQHAASARAGPF